MPTVPGSMRQQLAQQEQGPTPEQLLMTAADMHARGQLVDAPTSFTDPKSPLTLPGGARGPKSSRSHPKRR